MITPFTATKILPKSPQRWALALTFVSMALVSAALIPRFTRSELFPKANARFDITKIWVAAASDLCAVAKQGAPTKDVYDCVARLDINDQAIATKLKPVTIASLSQMLNNTSPSFLDLLQEQHLIRPLEALGTRQPLLIALQVPKALFSENRLGLKPNILVTGKLMDARICFLGSCPYSTGISDSGLEFPLFAPPLQTIPELVTVWVATLPRSLAKGITLEYGIFVTNLDDMMSVRSIFTPASAGSWTLAAATMFVVSTMALFYAILWAEYVEFTAFALMAGLHFLFAVYNSQAKGISLDVLPLAPRCAIWMLIVAQQSLASVCFAFASLRPRPNLLWRRWLATAVMLTPPAFFIGYFYHFTKIDRSINTALAIIEWTVPAFIAIRGGAILKQRLAQQTESVAAKAAASRRQNEQWVLGGCLMIAATPHLLSVFHDLNMRQIFDMNSIASLFLFPVFATLLFSSGGMFRRRTERYHRELAVATRQAAVGTMVQRISEEIRKPFALMQSGLYRVMTCHTAQEVQQAATELASPVTSAAQAITMTLENILAISSTQALVAEPTGVKHLVLWSLQDSLSLTYQGDFSFNYDFAGDQLLLVDRLKMLRVISNIIRHGVNATGGSGRFWFTTRFVPSLTDHPFELTIGYAPCPLTDSDRSRLCSSFFDADADSDLHSLALGLAVAQTLVNLHGSSILCRKGSSEGTEFVIHLQLSPDSRGALRDDDEVSLPNRSIDLDPSLNAI